MQLELTAVFRKVPEGYVGFVEELPGANTQGTTLEEARANLREAAQLVLEANRTLVGEAIGKEDVIREPLPMRTASAGPQSLTATGAAGRVGQRIGDADLREG